METSPIMVRAAFLVPSIIIKESQKKRLKSPIASSPSIGQSTIREMSSTDRQECQAMSSGSVRRPLMRHSTGRRPSFGAVLSAGAAIDSSGRSIIFS